jgi:galactonate dehydratase
VKSSTIERVRWHQLRVSPKTVWSFIELIDGAGRSGVGEATLGQREPQMRAALARFEDAVLGVAPERIDLGPHRAGARSLPEFAVVSALDQAMWDLAAQQRELSVAAALGPIVRDRVDVYANINRGIASRTPEGFAVQARCAVADGFPAILIAPFDEVSLYGDATATRKSWNLEPGLARIEAVRNAIGSDVELMVDCHWRLNCEAAEVVLRALEPQRIYWLECPVPEKPELLGTIREVRNLANAMGVRLAGCEEMSLVAGFAPFIETGCYDVMMPDAKYVGGLREMLRVAETLASHGVAFSPHNPSGPVCHAASLHVCAVAPSFHRLEMQYAETPLFDDVVGRMLPRAAGGQIKVPALPGLGVRLDSHLTHELAAEDGFARHAS